MTENHATTTDQRGLELPEVAAISGIGRTSLYAYIKTGQLVARKAGRRSLVLQSDLDNFLNSLPRVGVAIDEVQV